MTELGTIQELRDQRITLRTINQQEIVVLADGDKFFAFDRLCPHAKGDLSKARYAQGCLECVNHGLRFRLVDGSLDFSNMDEDLRDSINQEDWDRLRLRIYATRIENGRLYVID